jgi:hypothetical protein
MTADASFPIVRYAACIATALLVVSHAAEAQDPACQWQGSHAWLSTRPSPLDSAIVVAGSVVAKVCYSRPSARGRSIFETLAPFGKAWRTGANEPTTLRLSGPASVAGVALRAGRYILLTVPRRDSWVILFHTSPADDPAEIFRTLTLVGQGQAPTIQLDSLVEAFTIRSSTDAGQPQFVLEWGALQVRLPVEPRS